MTKPDKPSGEGMPCVLVVDDDPSTARRILRMLHERTTLTILIAENLGHAASIVEDRAFDIQLLVTDYIFIESTQDKRRKLFDGIDLIAFAQSRRRHMRVFVVSVRAETTEIRDKLNEHCIEVEGVLDKLVIGHASEFSKILPPIKKMGEVANNEKLFDIFLAYNSKDKSEVERIQLALTKLGMEVWYDNLAILPGRMSQREIEKALQSTKAIGVCIGGGGIGPWQSLEIDAAIRQFVDRRAPIIPIFLESAPATSVAPEFLRGFRSVRFGKPIAEERSVQEIIWGITGNRPE